MRRLLSRLLHFGHIGSCMNVLWRAGNLDERFGILAKRSNRAGNSLDRPHASLTLARKIPGRSRSICEGSDAYVGRADARRHRLFPDGLQQ